MRFQYTCFQNVDKHVCGMAISACMIWQYTCVWNSDTHVNRMAIFIFVGWRNTFHKIQFLTSTNYKCPIKLNFQTMFEEQIRIKNFIQIKLSGTSCYWSGSKLLQKIFTGGILQSFIIFWTPRRPRRWLRCFQASYCVPLCVYVCLSGILGSVPPLN